MTGKTSMNLEENVASALCYVLAWVTGIIFYLMEKENKTVRFHAMQSILTFIPLTILTWIFAALSTPSLTYGTAYGYTVPTGVTQNMVFVYLYWLLGVITLILWLVLMFKAYKGEKFKLPFIGDIAEKQIK